MKLLLVSVVITVLGLWSVSALITPEEATRVFKLYDADNDGKVTPREIMTYLLGRKEGEVYDCDLAIRRTKEIMSFDEDKSGYLSLDELLAYMRSPLYISYGNATIPAGSLTYEVCVPDEAAFLKQVVPV